MTIKTFLNEVKNRQRTGDIYTEFTFSVNGGKDWHYLDVFYSPSASIGIDSYCSRVALRRCGEPELSRDFCRNFSKDSQ